ncbi:DUF551 domain-containing protein [Yersinia mollaretii]|uniref:DUF551 domain-containing protein n=1 Tax=Yersinia mollaretii TaxID=33060 RepID=UPI0021BDD847|nr:DUF551 domain-containing protein [Yersinia mollaretii]
MDIQILQQINHWAACARLTSECSSVVHADLLEKAADHITRIESQLETARKRITELENAALVPGVLHCAKCNFQLSKTNLYMKSGTTGPGDNKTEPCPNGCGPLWPVTWRLWAFDASATADKYFDELKAAEARLSAANEKHGWIKCSDQMPEENDRILIFSDGAFVVLARYVCGEFYDVVSDGDGFFETVSRCVSHWMPLPAAPLVEGE